MGICRWKIFRQLCRGMFSNFQTIFQHDFYNNFDESDTEEEDDEKENSSQDSSWVDIGSGSEISGISNATNFANGSEISNHNKAANIKEEISKFRNKLIVYWIIDRLDSYTNIVLTMNNHFLIKIANGNEDQNANTNSRNDNEAEEYSGLAEGLECEKDLIDNIREDEENEQEVSDEDIRPVMVGSLLGAVISKTEEANKMKTAPFGRKKFKKKKKMETGLLKEILDFKPLGGRRHFSYH